MQNEKTPNIMQDAETAPTLREGQCVTIRGNTAMDSLRSHRLSSTLDDAGTLTEESPRNVLVYEHGHLILRSAGFLIGATGVTEPEFDPPIICNQLVMASADTETSPIEEPQSAAAGQWLPALEAARTPAERRKLFRILLRVSNPEAILECALASFDETRREGFLLHAVSLLESFGKRSWPAIMAVARSGRPETELFLGLMAQCEGDETQRVAAFRAVMRHAPPFVRLMAFEYLSSLGSPGEDALLNEMAKHDPDREVRAEAASRLNCA